jgi:outer membrane protein assembly factor BamD
VTATRLRHAVGFALLATALAAGCSSVNRPLAPATPEDQLRIARLRYENRDYVEAITLLNGYIQYRPDAPDLDEAHFLLGMAHVQRKEWPLAAGEFVVVTGEFPDSPRLSDAHYWLGVSYWRQARPAPYDQAPTVRAISQWQRFLALYPDHPKAAEARVLREEGRSRLAEKSLRNARLYLKLKHYRPAIVYFDEVIADYADTRWIDWARVGRAQALIGQNKPAEARRELEQALPGLKEAGARQRAEELLRKLPALPPTPATAPAADGAPG